MGLKTTSEPHFFCHAPWRTLYINPEGEVRLDNQSSFVLGTLEDGRSLKEIIKSEAPAQIQQQFGKDRLPDSCRNCAQKESIIGHSRRFFFQHKLEPMGIEGNQFKLEYLDLHLTNRCNLKCRMCNSESSSQWIEEDKILNSIDAKRLNRPKNPRVRRVNQEILKGLLRDPDIFKNLRYLALRGGEPLMEPLYLEIIDFLIQHGFAQQIILDLSTNGSFAEAKVLKRLNHFASVDFHLSVEGGGELYQYIRGGQTFSIDKLERNIQRFRELPNVHIIFAVTVSVYNILHLDELIEWFLKIKTDKDEIILSNTVVRPNYLQYLLIPSHLKLLAVERLEKILPQLKRHCSSPNRMIRDSGIDQLIDYLNTPTHDELERERLWRTFLSFNSEVDKMRKTRLVDIVPEYDFK